ncbi:methyltransferase domain-containing protein [Pacificispira sp.]|uniref:class I SAM-dependent DNA methyltransferase n=1 Tax=Pacificispira sp. TaxID=2888761 RepID=UPI003BAAC161
MQEDRLRAERRLNLGLALADEGDFAAASDAMTEACALAPDWADAHFALGETFEKLGRAREAEKAYRACLKSDPQDRMGAKIRLGLMGAAPVPTRLPAAYVEALFDQEARRFDKKMLDGLQYRGPDHMARAIERIAPDLAPPVRALDLGCGTGLGGRAMRLVAAELHGMDLSSGMLAQAASTGLYDRVVQADLLTAAWAEPDKAYHLIAATDVLNYIGDLAPVFRMAAEALQAGGYFVFTVEAGNRQDIDLGEGHRYRHALARLRPWIAAALLDIVAVDRCVLRQEKGRPVQGMVLTLRKPDLLNERPVAPTRNRGGARNPV